MKTCRWCQQPIIGSLVKRWYHPACRQARRYAKRDIAPADIDRRYTEALAMIQRRRRAA